MTPPRKSANTGWTAEFDRAAKGMEDLPSTGRPPREACRRCGQPIDRDALRADLATRDIPETAKRAAAASVFCSNHCALEDFGEQTAQP